MLRAPSAIQTRNLLIRSTIQLLSAGLTKRHSIPSTTARRLAAWIRSQMRSKHKSASSRSVANIKRFFPILLDSWLHIYDVILSATEMSARDSSFRRLRRVGIFARVLVQRGIEWQWMVESGQYSMPLKAICFKLKNYAKRTVKA